MTNAENGSSTAARLRAEIDAGNTAGKVGVSDPAAAPLGTDEEAAGTPLPKAAAYAALHFEAGAAGQMGRGRVDPHRPSDTRKFPWPLAAMVALIFTVGAVAVAALVF